MTRFSLSNWCAWEYEVNDENYCWQKMRNWHRFVNKLKRRLCLYTYHNSTSVLYFYSNVMSITWGDFKHFCWFQFIVDFSFIATALCAFGKSLCEAKWTFVNTCSKVYYSIIHSFNFRYVYRFEHFMICHFLLYHIWIMQIYKIL